MLKRINIKNSTIILVGIIIIAIGICLGLYEYFVERKEKTFSNMNVMLYEEEQPKNIVEENIQSENNKQDIQQEEQVTSEKPTTSTPNYLGILEIPKINLKRGFYGLGNKYNSVDYNVTVINGSTYPNIENNNLILAAHSGNCSICYFENLYKLKLGDIAYISYEKNKYAYKIVDIYEVEKDGTVAIYRDYNKSCLTLITCTRNSNTKQTVYILEQTN